MHKWESLQKGKMSALEFEPLWEDALADLETVRLGRTARELYLAYIQKVGPAVGAEIRKDHRPWPDPVTGGTEARRVATWEGGS